MNWWASFTRGCGIAFGIGTQLVFFATVYYLFFFLRDGATSVASNWLVIDLALALQFAVIHSFLLLPRTRSLLSRIMPGELYGNLFAMATCLCLALTFRYWQGSSILIWERTGWDGLVISTCFYASWSALLYSLKLVGLGYQTGWTQWLYWFRRQPLPRREFVERGVYRWMRHPVYLSFLGLIWFSPRMTADHAVLTGVWTAYIFIGSCLKDQRMTFYLGNTYRKYASRVPGYPGIVFGPLGRWRAAQHGQS